MVAAWVAVGEEVAEKVMAEAASEEMGKAEKVMVMVEVVLAAEAMVWEELVVVEKFVV